MELKLEGISILEVMALHYFLHRNYFGLWGGVIVAVVIVLPLGLTGDPALCSSSDCTLYSR